MAGSGRLAVLNSMLGTDIGSSVQRQRELGLVDADLKDGLFGTDVVSLTDDQAKEVYGQVAGQGMTVHCLSTQLFGDWVERGEDHFRSQHLRAVDRATELVEILQPSMVRLLACQAQEPPAGVDVGEHLRRKAPWVLEMYREATKVLRSAGVAVTVENELGGSVLASADDARSFFAALDLGSDISLTWDIQNMWALGTVPSVEEYRRLRPFIGYVHVKGGRAGADGRLRWRSSLRHASWPVREILAEVVADGVSPVVCVNPSHGAAPPGYDGQAEAEDDIRFLRSMSIGVV